MIHGQLLNFDTYDRPRHRCAGDFRTGRHLGHIIHDECTKNTQTLVQFNFSFCEVGQLFEGIDGDEYRANVGENLISIVPLL